MKAPFLVLLAALSALAVSQPAPWPMERQDRYGTARAIAGPPEQDLVPPYVFRTLSTEVASHAPSLGANGIGYFPTWVNNRLFKFDYRTGDVLGSFLTNNFNKSAPCISSDGSFVYLVNTPPLGNTGGLLYKINTDTMTTGWTFPVNTSHPNDWESNSATAGPDDDVVYGSSSGTAWRLDKTTGQPVWTKAGLGSVIRTIVFSRDDSKVFISNGQHLTAVDYTTGATAWSGDLGSVAGAPAVAPTGEVVVGNAMGQVRALNPDTGAILWTTSPGTKITGAPVFGDGKVYVPCHDQKLYAFSLANGTLAWEFTTSHPIWVGAIVDHLDRIYVWNRLGDLYCLRPNGDLVWTYRLPGGSRGPMSMGDDGTLYVSHSAEGGNLVHGVTMIGQKKIKVSALTVDPSTVSGGSSTTATVTIDSPAPKNGLRVDVTTNSSALIVPQFTTVPAQATSVSFTVGTTNVGAEAMRQVSATAGGVTRSASITIRPVPALASLTLNPSTVVSGSSSTGTVSLTRPASAGGAQVQLTANTTAISIPSSVTIAEGETSATFT
ncbi:MAG TPA: PQQ-binding-like beta-propeller repeat protein, partial [Fimbriimonadaceae bacterium]|nr:PQQ-binding-like beta-propeller repeat protein [Fimbriimonadaceae bacterium]